MSRLTSDVNGVKWFFSSTIVQMFTQVVRFVGGAIFLFYLEWRIAVPVILFLRYHCWSQNILHAKHI